jgi:serine/threonine protein kinase
MSSKVIAPPGFDVAGKIGAGAFGAVYKVKRRKDAKIFCLKQINCEKMSKSERDAASQEMRILSSLKHRNVLRFYESNMSKDGVLSLIVEYCELGDLNKQINQRGGKLFEEDQVWTYFIQICSGLHCTHSFAWSSLLNLIIVLVHLHFHAKLLYLYRRPPKSHTA